MYKSAKSYLCVAVFANGLIACTSQNSADVIASTQRSAIEICKFVPTPGTVTGILATLEAGASSSPIGLGAQIAGAVCNALKESDADRGLTKPNFNGVVIEGNYVS